MIYVCCVAFQSYYVCNVDKCQNLHETLQACLIYWNMSSNLIYYQWINVCSHMNVSHLFLVDATCFETFVLLTHKCTCSCKTSSNSMMLELIYHVERSLCGRLSGLGPANCSELNHQVITVLCGPRRQQIRLRGSMICSWKSTPLKLKSILSERLPKDKVLCIIENACLCVCVCWVACVLCVTACMFPSTLYPKILCNISSFGKQSSTFQHEDTATY